MNTRYFYCNDGHRGPSNTTNKSNIHICGHEFDHQHSVAHAGSSASIASIYYSTIYIPFKSITTCFIKFTFNLLCSSKVSGSYTVHRQRHFTPKFKSLLNKKVYLYLPGGHMAISSSIKSVFISYSLFSVLS